MNISKCSHFHELRHPRLLAPISRFLLTASAIASSVINCKFNCKFDYYNSYSISHVSVSIYEISTFKSTLTDWEHTAANSCSVGYYALRYDRLYCLILGRLGPFLT